MNYKFTPIIVFLWLFCSAQGCLAVSAYDNAKLTVWVSEAVVSTYTFDYKDLLQQQKQIAKYFTAEGWINYNKALQASKILESVKKNSYYVSAVPTMVPIIKKKSDNSYQGTVDILVLYKNPSYKQKQNLKITVDFIATEKQGLRGFAITSLKSVITEPPCRCNQPKTKAVATIV